MHPRAVANTTILHHEDDDVDLRYHFNAFISLFSVSGLQSSKGQVFQRSTLHDCIKI